MPGVCSSICTISDSGAEASTTASSLASSSSATAGVVACSLSVMLELVSTIKTPAFTEAIGRVLQLPRGAAPEVVRGDAEVLRATFVVSHAFESLGLLVFYRMLPLRFVDHLVGGYARSSWDRLKAFTADGRVLYGPTFGEWYQWLVERLHERGDRAGAPGAHRRYREWTP